MGLTPDNSHVSGSKQAMLTVPRPRLQPVRYLFRRLRAHPLRTAIFGISAVAGCIWAAVFIYLLTEMRRAERALAEERLDDAHRYIQAYLRVWNWNPSAHFLAARIERKLWLIDSAAEHLQEVGRQLGGAREREQLEWVLLRAQAGDVGEVEQGLWQTVNSGHPESLEILKTLAHAHLKALSLDKAMRALERWVELEPTSATAWFLRGWVLERFANVPQPAIDSYLKVLEIDPNHLEARLLLAEAYLGNYQTDAAGPHLEWLAVHHPNNKYVMSGLALYRYMKGDAAEARRLLDEVYALDPHEALALRRRGKIELQSGNASEAVTWLELAVAEDPNDFQTRFVLAQSLHRAGREKESNEAMAKYDECRQRIERMTKLIRELIPQNPGDAKLCAELGDILVQNGQQDRSIVWYNRALKIDPGCVAAHKALLAYHQSAGHTDDARFHREYLEHLNSKSP
jgi:tetratricopeptide (TPR) repeat protein